jgi:hypothetical protein
VPHDFEYFARVDLTFYEDRSWFASNRQGWEECLIQSYGKLPADKRRAGNNTRVARACHRRGRPQRHRPARVAVVTPCFAACSLGSWMLPRRLSQQSLTPTLSPVRPVGLGLLLGSGIPSGRNSATLRRGRSVRPSGRSVTADDRGGRPSGGTGAISFEPSATSPSSGSTTAMSPTRCPYCPKTRPALSPLPGPG